jgi:hypothetical protein
VISHGVFVCLFVCLGLGTRQPRMHRAQTRQSGQDDKRLVRVRDFLGRKRGTAGKTTSSSQRARLPRAIKMMSRSIKQMSKKLIPKLGKSFEMASSWLKWLHLGGFSANYALSLDQTTQLAFILEITSSEQEISAKQFLVVNLRGVADMVPFRHKEAISRHLHNLGISFFHN